MRHDCDECGACCRHTIIEIDEADLVREPRLIGRAVPFRTPPSMVLVDEDGEPAAELVPGYGAGASLNGGPNYGCPMQDGDRCTIYPTRPTCCLHFRAGSELCQSSREAEGLAALEPVPAGSATLPVI